MCRGDLPEGHLWNSAIGVQSKVIECDWCVSCGTPRPGYMNPATKADNWREGADGAEEEKRLQGLPAVEAPAPGSVSGTALREPPPGREEAA